MWGARGPFPPAAAMVVAVVMPIMFCGKATEKFNKTLKLVVCKQCLYTIKCIVTNITIYVTLIVAWPKPEFRSPHTNSISLIRCVAKTGIITTSGTTYKL
jgi:hypothetical protein